MAVFFVIGVVLVFVCAWVIPVESKPARKRRAEQSVRAALRADLAQAFRHREILEESEYLFSTTLNPNTFFGRYEDALFHAREAYPEKAEELERLREWHVNCFLSRCYEAGRLRSQKSAILAHRSKMSKSNVEHMEWMLRGGRL